jgi:hypothetical protein
VGEVLFEVFEAGVHHLLNSQKVRPKHLTVFGKTLIHLSAQECGDSSSSGLMSCLSVAPAV